MLFEERELAFDLRGVRWGKFLRSDQTVSRRCGGVVHKHPAWAGTLVVAGSSRLVLALPLAHGCFMNQFWDS
jgi:hypothetical protein